MKKLLCLLVMSAISNAAVAGEGSNLSSIIERALTSNSAIIAAKASLDASRAKIPQAGAWDDPLLSFGVMNLPTSDPSFSLSPMSGKNIGISQTVPISGSKATMKRIAKLESELESESANNEIAHVTWLIKDKYYELAYVNEALRLTKKNRMISEGLVNIARARFASDSKAPEQEIFQSKLDHLQYSKTINDLRQRREAILADLSSIVADKKTIPDPSMENLRPKQIEYNRNDILDYSSKHHPLIMARLNSTEISKKNIALAKQRWVPDVGLNFTYTLRDDVVGDPESGKDFFSAGASISLPIFGARKQAKYISETRAMLYRSQAMVEDTRLKIGYEVENSWSEYERAKDNAKIVSDSMLPNARAAFDASVTAYEAGKAEFINVLMSHLAVQNYELELVQSRMDVLRAIAKFDYLLWGMEGNDDAKR